MERGDRLRFASRVFDSAEQHCIAKIKDELVLRVTPNERWEIRALFYEDSREIRSITIQRFTIKTGNPHQLSFTFQGEEITKLHDFLESVNYLELGDDGKRRVEERQLKELLQSVDHKKRFLIDNADLIVDMLRNDVSATEIVALAHRKQQLDVFKGLLYDPDYFERTRLEWELRGTEAVWQAFFEQNPWIFGYGLDYIFTTGLDDKKLEQVTSGYDVNQSGKRVDALLRTRGLISLLCFVEIKTHETALIHNRPYRSECWRISDELSGSVAQIQKTVQKAMDNIRHRLDVYADDGNPTGESAFLYQPKSYVLIGNLGEFITPSGVNEQKLGSFELFRRNLANPEIITFDEMFHRAKYIVEHSEDELDVSGHKTSMDTVVDESADGISSWEEDIPF